MTQDKRPIGNSEPCSNFCIRCKLCIQCTGCCQTPLQGLCVQDPHYTYSDGGAPLIQFFLRDGFVVYFYGFTYFMWNILTNTFRDRGNSCIVLFNLLHLQGYTLGWIQKQIGPKPISFYGHTDFTSNSLQLLCST